MNTSRIRRLSPPSKVKEELPLTETAARSVLRGREAIQNVLCGTDGRLMAIVGPCSIHDEEAAHDFAVRLARLSGELSDRLLVVMRAYFEKPRTIGGWKGLISDPHLDGSFDMETGLRMARRLLLWLAERGLPAGTEFLEPFTPQYIDDLVSWAAIGARTIESQTHRQMASGLSMPVGLKNPTSGEITPAINAARAAAAPHAFLGIDEEGRSAIVESRGNKYAHLVLRGGGGKANADAESVANVRRLMEKAGIQPRIVVDCSHDNSGKRHEQQAGVFEDVVTQKALGQTAIRGVMLEANIHPGNQKLGDPHDLRYGVSITDACIGWEEMESLLRSAHAALS